MRTLAKMAGVSNATVSLALRRHPRISLPVQERILRLAAEVGYRSDPVVANLCAQLRSRKKTMFQSTLGILYLGKDIERLIAPGTVEEWISGATTRAESLGYSVDSFIWPKMKVTPARLLQVLRTRAIRGLVIITAPEGNRLPLELAPILQYTAAVLIGQRAFGPSLNFASNDQFSTALQAVDELRKLGYRRPGLCINPHLDQCVEFRFAGGFCAGQLKLLPRNRLPLFPFGGSSLGSINQRNFQRWVERYKPDVILTLHSKIREWIREMNLRVPEDIGLVNLDRAKEMDWAGMYQNSAYIGRVAVDLVIGQLHRNEFGEPPFQRCMLISSDWIAGPTVREQSPKLESSQPVLVPPMGSASKRAGREHRERGHRLTPLPASHEE